MTEILTHQTSWTLSDSPRGGSGGGQQGPMPHNLILYWRERWKWIKVVKIVNTVLSLIYPLSEWGICLFSQVVFAPPQKSRPQPGPPIKMGLELPLSLTDKDGGCFQGKVHCSLGLEGWPSQWFIFIKNTGWVYMFCQWQTFFGQKCDKESVGWAGWQTGGQTLVHAQLRYLFPHVSCQRQL